MCRISRSLTSRGCLEAVFIAVFIAVFSASTPAGGAAPGCHGPFCHVSLPHVTIGPVTVTPIGIVPTAAMPPIQKAIPAILAVPDAVVDGGTNVIKNAVQAVPAVQLVGVMAGQEKLSDAGKKLVKSPGAVIASVGEAVTETNAAAINVPVVAAQSIAGNVGKTTLTIVTGPERLVVDFAATGAIEAGGVMQGESAKWVIAEPLAAALRSAKNQFEGQANPLPADVKAKFASAYPPDVLDAARWTVGSISISVPDLVNNARLVFAGVENAVTVGNVTVFVRDPGSDYHWWAHELQHQVQYHLEGIDQFAYNYVTSCHEVESDAENKAQQVVPVPIPMKLPC
jgi:hypothetical protein